MSLKSSLCFLSTRKEKYGIACVGSLVYVGKSEETCLAGTEDVLGAYRNKIGGEDGVPGWLMRLSVPLLILPQVLNSGLWVQVPCWAYLKKKIGGQAMIV